MGLLVHHGAFSWIAFHSTVTVHEDLTLTYAETKISKHA